MACFLLEYDIFFVKPSSGFIRKCYYFFEREQPLRILTLA